MTKTYPNKYIRKAISEALNNLTVNGNVIKTYDTRVSISANEDFPKNYIIMSTQSNGIDKGNKCGWMWESAIVIDIFTTYPSTGNTGSRLLLDDITEAVKNRLNGLVLDVSSGLTVERQSYIFPNDLVTVGGSEIVYRTVFTLQLLIN